jgi:hypothetical protein
MSEPNAESGAITDSILAALGDPKPTWITLPPATLVLPQELRTAIDAFDAGPRAAGQAATMWLTTQAQEAYETSRTRLLIVEHRVAGFYSLAAAQVGLRRQHRRMLGLPQNLVSVPAALITWIGKDRGSGIDGADLLRHATATARRAAALQAAALLVVDPFDDETDEMWRSRYGFRSSSQNGALKRLWLPLALAA